MSAPLVVNTRDGACWTRRTVTEGGIALYALADVCKCPEFVMVTLAELAERGIVGSADVLPVPFGPEPQADPVAAGRRLDLLALMDERAASVVSPCLAAVLDEAERLRANERAAVSDAEIAEASRDRWRTACIEAEQERDGLRARVAELEALLASATEFRVWEPGYGLWVRRAPEASGFAILEARRTSAGRRAWTAAGWRYQGLLSDSELFCWPDAESAVAEARRVLPGAVVREDEAPGPRADESADKLTRLLAPTQVLREDVYESPLHRDHRISHDMPETGGAK